MNARKKCCRNCAAWRRERQYGPDSKWISERVPGMWGSCSKMEGTGGEPDDKTQLAFGHDASSYAAGVETHETFMCAMFSRITEAK